MNKQAKTKRKKDAEEDRETMVYKLFLTYHYCNFSLIAAGAAVKFCNIDESNASPYFTLTTETDGIDMVTVLHNEGGNIHGVNCKQICYVEVSYQDRQGSKVFLLWLILISTNQSTIMQREKFLFHNLLLTTLSPLLNYMSRFLIFGLDEELYKKWEGVKGNNYYAREINVSFEHCFLLEYKDYRDRDGQAILRLTGNDFDFLNIKDIPKVNSDATFVLGESGPDEVCKYIFDKCNVNYSFSDGKFTFIR